MRVSRINKIITWDGKEYAHVIETEPSSFCDQCVFSDLCQKVLYRELAVEDSPMKVCNDLCTKENTHFAFFMEANRAEDYCDGV